MTTTLYANETQGALPPSWYVASAPAFPDQPQLDGTVTADVCVIGAGFTGLSTALRLAETGVSVVVVEAHRVGWGASGRNGGQVGVGQRQEPEYIAARADPGLARAAWEIGRDAARLVRDMATTGGIEAGYRPGVMYVNHRPRYDAGTKAHVDFMRGEYGHDVEYLPPEEVRARLGARGMSAGLLEPSGGHLHPLAFARGLAARALAAGARIYERTEATWLDGTRVIAATGEVRAERVVVACNGYLGTLLPEVAAKTMPINNFIVATEPLAPDLRRALIRDDVAVADSRFVVNYFRLSEDGRMLFGGGESYGWRFPRDIAALVRPRMLALFPQLAEARIDHAWGGTLAITPTRLPVWGEIRPGVLNASGYSGSGVALATMAGTVLAEWIAGDRRRFETMAALPVPRFPGGAALRRPALWAAMLLAQIRDAL
ncbi:MAG: FAD-binding oxidoreductase [Pseudomonadota bacterium]|nr:FAD-binding oxidoreductase [Pseudomonadota bacterium]